MEDSKEDGGASAPVSAIEQKENMKEVGVVNPNGRGLEETDPDLDELLDGQ